MISGDDNTHWYHLQALVTEADYDKKKLVVSMAKNQFFDSEEVKVDCGKKTIDIGGINVGDQITIYFFKNCISENTVKAEEIR